MANESLNPLRTFDAAHGAELMATLESYLNNNGSVAAVAEDLTLHRNTVRYRLAQITELTGYDPAQTPDRVQLWLALAVQRLGGTATRAEPAATRGVASLKARSPNIKRLTFRMASSTAVSALPRQLHPPRPGRAACSWPASWRSC